jgi:hypothetical protein
MSLDKAAEDFLGTKTPKQMSGQTTDAGDRQKKLAAATAAEGLQRAAVFTEEIINWLNKRALELDLDPEQRIFAVALATINLRQNFPAERGGKDFFDKVSRSAWEYYDVNSK